ncbi:hypothetical protein HDC33_000061 [Sporosarcina sp. JAI121]|nr:hypothetical protein [Sporosarcina sp. JAI121]
MTKRAVHIIILKLIGLPLNSIVVIPTIHVINAMKKMVAADLMSGLQKSLMKQQFFVVLAVMS